MAGKAQQILATSGTGSLNLGLARCHAKQRSWSSPGLRRRELVFASGICSWPDRATSWAKTGTNSLPCSRWPPSQSPGSLESSTLHTEQPRAEPGNGGEKYVRMGNFTSWGRKIGDRTVREWQPGWARMAAVGLCSGSIANASSSSLYNTDGHRLPLVCILPFFLMCSKAPLQEITLLSWETEIGGKRGRGALPQQLSSLSAAAADPHRTRHTGRPSAMWDHSAGQLWQLLAAKTAATPPLPATPLSAQADEPSCLGELPRSSDAVPLKSFTPSMSQVAINGEVLTHLKLCLLSSKTNERSQQKATLFPLCEILGSTEISQLQSCKILKILCPHFNALPVKKWQRFPNHLSNPQAWH